MLSEQEEVSACALFDSYCHTVLRNAIRNYTKHISIQEKYEFLAEYPETYVKKSCARRDEYEGDHLYVVYSNRSYQLDNELLLQAMQSLQERELGVSSTGTHVRSMLPLESTPAGAHPTRSTSWAVHSRCRAFSRWWRTGNLISKENNARFPLSRTSDLVSQEASERFTSRRTGRLEG